MIATQLVYVTNDLIDVFYCFPSLYTVFKTIEVMNLDLDQQEH